MSNDFHKQVMALNFGSADSKRRVLAVWAPTPFMVNAWIGRIAQPRLPDMLAWCRAEFGRESSPSDNRVGRWRRDGMMDRWSWFGFSTQAELDAFTARWPAPDGFEAPGP